MLFKSLAVALTLALTSTAALADHKPEQVAFKKPDRGNQITLDAQRVMGRGGMMTLDVGRGARLADLKLISTDARVDIRRIVIEYASGRRLVLRGNHGRVIDLPEAGVVTAVKVQYANRGARGAMIKLVAKDARPGRPGFQQR